MHKCLSFIRKSTWFFVACGMISMMAVTTIAANSITIENSLPGNPASEWDIVGAGDSSIQGFATDISVNKGETVRFKVDTNARAYQIDIYRIGYYQGRGARKITTVTPSVTLPQIQPDPLYDPATGWWIAGIGRCLPLGMSPPPQHPAFISQSW